MNHNPERTYLTLHTSRAFLDPLAPSSLAHLPLHLSPPAKYTVFPVGNHAAWVGALWASAVTVGVTILSPAEGVGASFSRGGATSCPTLCCPATAAALVLAGEGAEAKTEPGAELATGVLELLPEAVDAVPEAVDVVPEAVDVVLEAVGVLPEAAGVVLEAVGVLPEAVDVAMTCPTVTEAVTGRT
jgi:hypothetical protein